MLAQALRSFGPQLVFSSPFQCPAKQGREELLTVAVERGLSEGTHFGSKESSLRPCTTPSEVARCASTFQACAFREQEDDQAAPSHPS